jgi:uracil-DNA glycosylase family 4
VTALPAELAERTADLDDLAARVRRCTACPELAATRTQDLAGVPFVGRAGQLLDELLAAAGLDRSTVAVANVLKCRPPGNRTPTRAEVGRGRPWLDRQLALAAPRVVVTLGGTAAGWAFAPGVRIADVRGRVHDRGDHRLVATYHPSAALRFGPRGAPRAALAEDLVLAAETLGRTL